MLRLSAYTVDYNENKYAYESLVDYLSMKEYRASFDSAVSALGNGNDDSIDNLRTLVKNKYSYTNEKMGSLVFATTKSCKYLNTFILIFGNK